MIAPDEVLHPIGRAVELVTGSWPSPSKSWRWRRKGVHGVRLATVMVGGRRKTSVEAVRRFSAEITAVADDTRFLLRDRH